MDPLLQFRGLLAGCLQLHKQNPPRQKDDPIRHASETRRRPLDGQSAFFFRPFDQVRFDPFF
jgi:hypothetical protein